MQSTTIIRLIQGRLAWYPPGAAAAPEWLDNDSARDKLRAALTQQRQAPCFAAPGCDVRLSQLEISAAEKRHLGKSLPFMLEEQVAADIESLHFAAALGKTGLAVAICSVDKMLAWQALLADFPGIKQWIPEPLLLPWQAGQWCIVHDGDDAIVRIGAAAGFSVESAMLPVLLAAALEAGEDPREVVCYGQQQAEEIALLPPVLQERVQWRRGNLYSALMLSESGTGPAPLNLLQGAFGARLPLALWWRQWRAVAVAAGVAFALQLAAGYSDYFNLQRDNVALRGAVEQSYRKAYPRGAVVEPEKQLRRQLSALRGSGEATGFVRLLERVGAITAGSPGTAIATLNYSDKGGEMRMNIVAADFEAVEQLRADLNKAGLQAVMESSSAQGDAVRARLRVGEGS